MDDFHRGSALRLMTDPLQHSDSREGLFYCFGLTYLLDASHKCMHQKYFLKKIIFCVTFINDRFDICRSISHILLPLIYFIYYFNHPLFCETKNNAVDEGSEVIHFSGHYYFYFNL